MIEERGAKGYNENVMTGCRPDCRQKAYVNGYWKELAAFTRGLFNSAFKTNPYLERAIMTGITRVSKESIFSDLNNL